MRSTTFLLIVLAASLLYYPGISAQIMTGSDVSEAPKTFPLESGDDNVGSNSVLSPEDGFTIKTGMALNFFHVKGINDAQVENLDDNNYISPVIGVGYMLTTKWLNHRLSYLLQMKMYEYENSGMFRTNYDKKTGMISQIYDTVYYNAAAQWVLLPSFSIGYKLINKQRSKLLISPGLSSYILKHPYFVHSEIDYATASNKVVYTANLSVDYYFSDWMILWGMYNLPATTEKDDYFVGNHSDLQFGVGVRF